MMGFQLGKRLCNILTFGLQNRLLAYPDGFEHAREQLLARLLMIREGREGGLKHHFVDDR
jgi:hypothetical protein